MQVYIYRLTQYTYIQDDTYTHRYASISILHIGRYSYTLIHILAFKIAFFAVYSGIDSLYTYTYIQADTYTLNITHKDTLVQAYIYMLIQLYINTYI